MAFDAGAIIEAEKGYVMNRSRLTGQRLVATFLLGCILLNYPLLSLLNRAVNLFDIPLLYAYIFLVWAGLIALMGWVIEHRGS